MADPAGDHHTDHRAGKARLAGGGAGGKSKATV